MLNLIKINSEKDVSSNEDISFEIKNEHVTGTSPKFFEFDIMVTGNTNNTYFYNAIMVIKYSNYAFGDNIVQNNKVTITKGLNFSATCYEDPMNIITDDGGNTIKIPFGETYNCTPTNRTQITTFEQQLLHVKFEITNCNGYTNFSFIDTLANGMDVSFFAMYTLEENIDTATIYNYDNVEYVEPSEYELCAPPTILNFYPNPITAGTNSVLTIEGYGFGATRGSGQLWLADNNGINNYIKHFDYIDYVSWTDTEIKFIVPSTVDTLPALYNNMGVGTGYIRVKRDDGVTDFGSYWLGELIISYTNMNVSVGYGTSDYKKIPMRVISDYSDTTKHFYLDTSITNNPQMEIAVREALEKWSCSTLINWDIIDTIELQHNADGYSVIYLDDNFHGIPLARTYHSQGGVCTDDLGNLVAYYKDIDIGLSRDFNNIPSSIWFIDTSATNNLPTNQEDFFAVVQHELGHAHGLDHVNDTTDIMNAHSKRGPVPAFYRRDVYSSSNSVLGGTYILQKSELLTNCSSKITTVIPSSSSNCETEIKVNELFNNNLMILAYPNPLSDILNIEFKLERNAKIYLTLYDNMGKKVTSKRYNKLLIGKHYIQLNTSNLSQGLYFLNIKVNNRFYNTKLIKY